MKRITLLLVVAICAVVSYAQILTGTVKDASGEGLTGASVTVVGTSVGANVDLKGQYTLKNVRKGAKVKFSFIGYKSQVVTWSGTGNLDVVLEEESTTLTEAVVTAMGIVRKATSLTYSTQQLKSDDLMKVQDPNLVNGMEGKISGVTITPSAGGAGGASKILLRGNKSILGNNAPLIVVDGVPMTNNTRGQMGAGANIETSSGAEGSDPLSMINPDDIESMNVLKGANAAALYGSQAANGVVMITTKKGKEGRLEVSFTSNVTFDTPLLTPRIQNDFGGNIGSAGISRKISSWGLPVNQSTEGIQYVNVDKNFMTGIEAGEQGKYVSDMYGHIFPVLKKDANGNYVRDQLGNYTLEEGALGDYAEGVKHAVHVRNAAKDDVADFFRMGVTTNNSVSFSGGTEKMKNYFSYANSYSNGMVPNNNYMRNTFALRQNYTLWKRLYIDVNANYVTTRTKNRVGGGTCGNPLYDLYLTPRDVDMDYYRENYVTQGIWKSSTDGSQRYYELDRTQYYDEKGKPKPNVNTATLPKANWVYDANGNRVINVPIGGSGYLEKYGFAFLGGDMQNWAIQNGMRNNPYWLLNQNTSVTREDRFYGSLQAKIDIYDGLAFQARASIDQSKYSKEGHSAATTWGPNTINAYGSYYLDNSRTSEIYTDYLLSYNKTFKDDWSVSATAGFVAHTIKGVSNSLYAGNATYDFTGNTEHVAGIISPISTYYNIYDPQAGSARTSSKSKSSNWDRAALGTLQLGWKDMIYVDGSYRRDWYRAFRQSFFDAPDNYGYFGFGASAILSQLFKLAEPVSYLKYRLSYSEVGNSIPNIQYAVLNYNFVNGAYTANKYNSFTPIPEKTRSFETGFESQFFNNALNLDVTYYNSAMCNSYLTIDQGSRIQPVNTGKVRNQGIEMTIGYDWQIGRGWRWKTNVNFSYNRNKIISTYIDEQTGDAKPIDVSVANNVKVRYEVGGEYGDMYSFKNFDVYGTDVYRLADGTYSASKVSGAELVAKAGDYYVNANNKLAVNNQIYNVVDGELQATQLPYKYIGNMNSKYQLSWSNTFSYKGFNLYFLINGRIGGKVLSLTELYLDQYGVSQRTADDRNAAIGANLYLTDEYGRSNYAMYINEGRNLVSVEDFYTAKSSSPANYVYDATNFRLRELSLGYTWRDLFGNGKNLSLSVVGRNLFFIYKKAPVDPDVSLATGNGMNGLEMFNVPSSRSFGVNLKLNF